MKIKSILIYSWDALGFLYAPIYILFWVIHKLARIMLAVSYFGMLSPWQGKDILRYLFKPYGKY